jgi:hypothetical protein
MPEFIEALHRKYQYDRMPVRMGVTEEQSAIASEVARKLASIRRAKPGLTTDQALALYASIPSHAAAVGTYLYVKNMPVDPTRKAFLAAYGALIEKYFGALSQEEMELLFGPDTGETLKLAVGE